MSCESTIRSEENSLGWYLKNSNENFLQGQKYVKIMKLTETVSDKDFGKLLNEKRIENWREEKMYMQFISDMPGGTDKEQSSPWKWNCDLKTQTVAWYNLHKNKQ